MSITIPLWTILPGALALIGLWLMFRRREPSGGYFDMDFTPLLGVACLIGAALFLLGRCAA